MTTEDDDIRPSVPPLRVDMAVGKYRAVRKIGAGGMAEVWMARKKLAKGERSQYVVLKVVQPHLALDPRFVRMFRNEVELTALLTHANIVKLLDFGEDNHRQYMVLEWIDGTSLQAVREALAGESLVFRCFIAAYVTGQVLHALHYAHRLTDDRGTPLGIVHRDVTPHNVLVSNHGDIKLGDFGIAHQSFDRSSGTHIKGKIRYMAPEQLSGNSHHPAVDLFAVGALMHELIDGAKFRHDVEDDRVLTGNILDGRIPELRLPIDPALDEVRRGLLEPAESLRIPTAEAALEMLHGWRNYTDMKLPLGRLVGKITGSKVPRTGYLNVPKASSDQAQHRRLAPASKVARKEEEDDDDSKWFVAAFAPLAEDYPDAPPRTNSIRLPPPTIDVPTLWGAAETSPTDRLQATLVRATPVQAPSALAEDVPQRIVHGLTLKASEVPRPGEPENGRHLSPSPFVAPPAPPPGPSSSTLPETPLGHDPLTSTHLLPMMDPPIAMPGTRPPPAPVPAVPPAGWDFGATSWPSHTPVRDIATPAPTSTPYVSSPPNARHGSSEPSHPPDTRFIEVRPRRSGLVFAAAASLAIVAGITLALLMSQKLDAPASPSPPIAIAGPSEPSRSTPREPTEQNPIVIPRADDTVLRDASAEGVAAPANEAPANEAPVVSTAPANAATLANTTPANEGTPVSTDPTNEPTPASTDPAIAASQPDSPARPEPRGASGPSRPRRASSTATPPHNDKKKKSERSAGAPKDAAPLTGPVYINVRDYPSIQLRIGTPSMNVAPLLDTRIPAGSHVVRWLPEGETRWHNDGPHRFMPNGTYHVAISRAGVSIRGGL